jgi:hypothetical protein
MPVCLFKPACQAEVFEKKAQQPAKDVKSPETETMCKA